MVDANSLQGTTGEAPGSWTRVRARYAETDQMGVVYHANYFVWMEVARVEFCRAMGFEYRDMEREDGVYLAVAEARCRFFSPARFDDEVVIATKLCKARSRAVRFAYEMRRAEGGGLLASGETLHVVVDRRGRGVRLPERYRRFFASPAS